MKKGPVILLLTFACGICMVLGIFIGRNHRQEFQPLSQNAVLELEEAQEPITDTKLDINTASKVQLMDLPGIGEELAERIIRYRTDNGPFESTDDLLMVEGIGEKKLLDMEARIKVGG